jgi:hypothetical protein
MGSIYQYTCKCGYEAQVSGGPDIGFSVKTQTKTCTDCQILVDVVVGPSMPDMPLDEELEKSVGKCPQCNHTNVTKWPETKPCPKCGETMQQGHVEILWD